MDNLNAKWNFPKYNYGRRQGISDSGVETFKGDRYRHLAKEICQNSLDAAMDTEKPVTVEFQKFYVDKADIPEYKRYEEVFMQCYENSKTGTGKVKEFFDYAMTLLKKKISVLRISDFNTTGLSGSKKEKDTPWNDLIKAAGISNKGGEAGGSFGIGKYAAFACSNLRTVFYNTLDKEGIKAHQGVTEVITFRDVDGEEKDGEGYFGIGKENLPVFNELFFDPNYKRENNIGTDIYILGFIEQENWIESIIYSVIDSFLIAIYNGKLEVKVADTLINKHTLSDIIENKLDYSKSDRGKGPLEYYKVLTSEEAIIKTFPLNEHNGDYLGEYKLYLLIDNELSTRRILMSRINGMKVFEQDRFPKGIPFCGICILQDKKINNYFRKMETPEHDAWKADQYSEDPQKIRKANETRLTLIRTIRDELNKLASETTLDETDIGDLGMLLPDLEDDFLANKTKIESLEKEEKEAKINIRIEDKKKDIKMPVYVEETGDDGVPDSGNISNTKNTNSDEGLTGLGKQRVPVDSLRIRMFQKGDYEYRLVINAVKDIINAELILSAVGEDKKTREEIRIKEALDSSKNTAMDIHNKKIKIGNLAANDRLVIDFKPDIIDQLSMEVGVYAD